MKVNSLQAASTIQCYLDAGLVPLLIGSPGIGKSQIYQQIADKFKLKLIDVRLSQADPTDLMGFPTIVGNKASYIPMDTFPIEGDPLPENCKGWLLLFDELTSAVPAIQAASYKIILDRMVGQYYLHPNVAICAAGNMETDGAVVHEMSTALQSRMVHLELIVDFKVWCEWAMCNDIDHRITDFIQFKPGHLYTFKADHTDRTYACPRTWEFANRLLAKIPSDPTEKLILLAGTLSEGVAREFITFMKIYSSLPKMADIIKSPLVVDVPNEPSILFALTGSIAHNMDNKTAGDLMQYLTRLPIEFQVVCLRETVRRNKPLLSHAAIQKWVANNAAALF